MKSRRWRYGVLRRWIPLFLLGTVRTIVLAACPPNDADGNVLTNGKLQLAWRPLLQDDTPVAMTAIPMARHFALAVQLCEERMASQASLKRVDATMPEHRHGMNYQPRISPLGDGRFRVEGLMFHMSGRWQIEFEVQNGNDVSRLLHDVQIR